MAVKKAARSLAAYDAKRDFTHTPEPRGKPASKRAGAGGRSFCVQKHLASHLHYDFRLEHNGVLLSWAVPRGPSLNPADKRMAVRVEDHPVEYGTFEGVIPSGYGAGVVMLWDRGTWSPERESADVDAALEKGQLKFRVNGAKLKGSWVLVRIRRQVAGRPEQWLLIKHRDRWSGEVDVTQLAESVKTSRGFPAILAEHGTPAEWKRNPPARGGDVGRLLKDVIREANSEAPAQPKGPAKKRPAPAATQAAAKARRSSTSTRQNEDEEPSPAPPKRATFTNRQKVLFPADGFTKGDLIDYYTRIAPVMLPQLAGRAVTFKRYPDGVDGKFFFQKRCPEHRPPWIKTVHVPGETARDKTIDYCTIDSVAALQWAANQAAIELHVPLALAAEPDLPTAVVFDLDPGPPATLGDCVEVGLRLKGLLDGMGLKSLPKTSGGKGLHVLVPLNTPYVTFADTKRFAKAVVLTLQKDDPKRVIASIARSQRAGRVFIDWGQNDRDKTNAAVFSVRARERPTVSWPLSWEAMEGGEVPTPVSAREAKPNAATRKWLAALGMQQSLPRIGRESR